MEFVVGLGALVALAWKFVDFSKQVTNKDWNAALTQVYMWLAGLVAVLLGANADAFEAIIIPGMEKPLGDLNFWSLVIIGLSFTSVGSVAYDFKKAFDNSDSAKMPPLTHQ